MRKSLQDIANDMVRRDDEQLSTSIDPMRRRKGPYIIICIVSLLIAVFFVVAFNIDLIKRKLEFRKPMKEVPNPRNLDHGDEIRIHGDGIGSRVSPSRKEPALQPKVPLIRFFLRKPKGDVNRNDVYRIDPSHYRLSSREGIDADLASHSKTLLRFRTHVTDAFDSFSKVRGSKGESIGADAYICILGTQGDFPGIFVPREDEILISKLLETYRGDRVQVFGELVLTDAGFVVIVHDFIAD